MALPPAAVGAGIGAPGGVPAAPPAAPVPQAAPTPAQPKNYREMFGDAVHSPAPGRTLEYLQGYRFADGGLGPVPAPVTLRDQTVTLSDRRPMAFLCYVEGVGGVYKVAIVHRLLRFMDMPGETASGYHDRVLGMLGDIMPHQYPTVEVPSTAFQHLVGTAVRLPTTDAMKAHLATWDDPMVPLGPFTDQEPETEVNRPRHAQLIPCRYAALLVHRRGVSAKVAYQEIVGAIRAQNEMEACVDIIITWLKAACTAKGGGGRKMECPVCTTRLHRSTSLVPCIAT